jgi:RNA polymerase sigma factor (TIGR02999 family)
MSASDSWQGLLSQADNGDRSARDRLFATFYDELRRLAQRELQRGAGPLVTLTATALVHEAYAGLASRENLAFPDKGRFMAYMARAMRGFIIDSARERRAQKRGSEFHITFADKQPTAG